MKDQINIFAIEQEDLFYREEKAIAEILSDIQNKHDSNVTIRIPQPYQANQIHFLYSRRSHGTAVHSTVR